MSIQDWALISDRAIMFAGIVYALAFLSHIIEWAVARTAVPKRQEVLAGVAGEAVGPVDPAGELPPERPIAAERYGRIGLSLTILAAGLHLVGLVARGFATEPARVPWGNMYEFTLAGTFGVAVIYLTLMRLYHLRWLGMLVTGFLVVVLMVNALTLYQQAGPLVPALQSYWLVIHVLGAILATGAFTVGGILSALYLVKEAASRRRELRPGSFLSQVPSLEVLDRLSYRLHAVGFPIWTFAALVAGPIWAQYAWGRYWNWDPKEIWAFITWVVYAAYLHARATAGYKGRIVAIIALIGLATLLFNFVGINFFFGSTSQHSYA